MDSFLGVGLPELLVILLLAGVIMGPQQILRVARLLGVWTARLQRYYRSFVSQLNEEIDTLEAQDVKEAFKEVQKFGQQMNSLRQDVRTAPSALLRQGGKAAGDANRQLRAALTAGAPAVKEGAGAADGIENSIQPPQPVEIEDDPAI